MATVQPHPRRRLVLKVSALLAALLLIWGCYDLFAPRTAHLRQFNPDKIASRETDMWRSYYERRRLRLFNELSELLRDQYNMPLLRSYLVAYHGAHAALVFQRGKERADYEQALPDLLRFYWAIRKMSDTPFDVDRAARLELEWWIVHRERDRHAPEDLARSLAELQAEIYQVPVDRLLTHGELRAEAMTIRDTKARTGGVNEEDWNQIDRLLRESWRSLSAVVKTV